MRTLPGYTRNSLTTLPGLMADCGEALARGYALDNEEAEMDVGCIGVLIHDGTGNVSAGLSVSAPIARRRLDWVTDLIDAGSTLSARLGYRPAGRLK